MSLYFKSGHFSDQLYYTSPILRAFLDSGLDLVTKSNDWRRGLFLDLVSTKRLRSGAASGCAGGRLRQIFISFQWGIQEGLAAWQRAVCSALCFNTLSASGITPCQIPRTGALLFSGSVAMTGSLCDLIHCEIQMLFCINRCPDFSQETLTKPSHVSFREILPHPHQKLMSRILLSHFQLLRDFHFIVLAPWQAKNLIKN